MGIVHCFTQCSAAANAEKPHVGNRNPMETMGGHWKAVATVTTVTTAATVQLCLKLFRCRLWLQESRRRVLEAAIRG